MTKEEPGIFQKYATKSRSYTAFLLYRQICGITPVLFSYFSLQILILLHLLLLRQLLRRLY